MADPFDTMESEHLQTQQPETRISPLRLIASHYLLLILGAVVGAVVGALYYARVPPIYESSVQVLVVNNTRNPLPVGDTGGSSYEKDSVESDLATQQIIIRSPVIVGAAVRNGNLAQLPSLAEVSDPTGSIISSLKISQELSNNRPTNILNLSMRGAHSEELPDILKAVLDSYKRFLKGRYQNVADETAKLIVDANNVLKQQLTKKQNEYNVFLAQLPTELWKGKDGTSSIQLRLMSLENKRVDFLNREADLQGRLQALEMAMKDGRHTRAELLIMIAQGKDVGYDGKEGTEGKTTDRLMSLKLKEKNLLEDYGKDHPEVRQVRDQLALLNGRVRFSDNDPNLDADPVESYVRSLKLEQEYLRAASQTLARLLQDAHKEAKPLRSKEIQDESFRQDIARSQQLFDAISKRLDEISILKNANGGYDAEIINPATVGQKVAPKAVTVFAAAIILGLLAGFGLAYLTEVSDQSFRTPEEIRRRLGLPVVGHVPFFAPEDEETIASADGPQVAPTLCTYYRPKSREAEAIRGVRTALFFNKQGGHSLIQITSPDKGDGKSTLSSNLAVSIAQAEKKVILIDADFRRPNVHKLFNVNAEKGLVSVMSGEAKLAEVIQTTAIPSLSLLPCGPVPPNPAELLTLPRFKEMLETLRGTYDYVLVDTPPLLAVTDPCTVVPYVDGVLLTIRISKNARPNAMRAKEILTSLGANIIGVVVNGVGAEASRYGYGGSRYGHGGYGYSYGYSYKNYYTYSNYESDGSAPSETGGVEVMQEDATADSPKRQRSYSTPSSRKKSGFFAWLFNR